MSSKAHLGMIEFADPTPQHLAVTRPLTNYQSIPGFLYKTSV